MIRIENLWVKIGKRNILKGCTLSLQMGEIAAVVGNNGTGKTTLLKTVSGFLKPYQGEILWERNEAEQMAGFIETPCFWNSMTGRENIEYYLGDSDYFDEAVFWEMDAFLDKKVGKYSLGMKQKLALIIAFTSHRSFLIFDEPTNSLDQKSVERFYQRLLQAKEEGVSVLFVTHLLQGLEQVCDKIYVLNQGKIQSDLLEKLQEIGRRFRITFASTAQAKQAVSFFTENELQNISGGTLLLKEGERSVSEMIRASDSLDILEVKRAGEDNREYILSALLSNADMGECNEKRS